MNEINYLSFEGAWGDQISNRIIKSKQRGGIKRTQPKANAIRSSDKAQLRRIVNHAPEVFVKISSPAKSDKSGNTINVSSKTESGRVGEHIAYITRNGDLELETSTGELLNGRGETDSILNKWLKEHEADVAMGVASEKTRITRSIVLSMPIGTNPNLLLDAVRATASESFGRNHEYIFAQHHDSEGGHPHVHLTIKNVGFNGKKLSLRKAEVQNLRENFAKNLRHRGIVASATSRKSRGIKSKGTRTPIKKMRDRGITPYTDTSKLRAGEHDLINNVIPNENAWDRSISKGFDEVLEVYETAAEILSRSIDKDDLKLSVQTKSYINKFGKSKTEREIIYGKLLDKGTVKEKADKER